MSSRFEGVVYKVDDTGHYETAVTDVGVACGLAFTPDGALLVGDRSGTIFRVLPNGQAAMIASLPASVAAFHLAMGPDGTPVRDRAHAHRARSRLPRVARREGGGRLVGLRPAAGAGLRSRRRALHRRGAVGASGLYRVELESAAPPQLVLSGAGLVGVAFDPLGGLVVASNDTAWRLEGL